MFTGIVEEIGNVVEAQSIGQGIRFRIRAPRSALELQVSDSVAINGVCQTVVGMADSDFSVEAVEETLKKTTLAALKVNDCVNLELPLRFGERLGGHLVLGHVDGVGEIVGIDARENSWIFSITVPDEFVKYVIPVGSIAVDGVSLTVAEIEGSLLRISIIPHTMANTIFQWKRIGDSVNLEFDVLGKYVERLMIPRSSPINHEREPLSEKRLRELGF